VKCSLAGDFANGKNGEEEHNEKEKTQENDKGRGGDNGTRKSAST